MPKRGSEGTSVKRAGTTLRKIRSAFGWTSEEVERKSEGRLIRQQLTRLERGEVARPTMYDLCILATLYERTPNDMAELYDYWHGNHTEPDHPRIRHLKQLADELPESRREDFYRRVEVDAMLLQDKLQP